MRNVMAPGVVGRERELSDLPRVLDVVVADGPRALVVRGEAGIGRTTIWRAARARGTRVRVRFMRRPSQVGRFRFATSSVVPDRTAVKRSDGWGDFYR